MLPFNIVQLVFMLPALLGNLFFNLIAPNKPLCSSLQGHWRFELFQDIKGSFPLNLHQTPGTAGGSFRICRNGIELDCTLVAKVDSFGKIDITLIDNTLNNGFISGQLFNNRCGGGTYRFFTDKNTAALTGNWTARKN